MTLAQLRDQVAGKVIGPDDAECDEARLVYNAPRSDGPVVG
jgi:hypothetical protein